jgi:hypothetical protein
MKPVFELRLLVGLAFLVPAALACVPEVAPKADATTGGAGGGGGGGGTGGPVVCVEPSFEEWSYDTGYKELLLGTIGDINRDGFGDALMPFQASAKTVVRWGAASAAEVGSSASYSSRPSGWVRHGDFDGNGLDDLIVVSIDTTKQTLLFQQPDRSFTRTNLEEKCDGRALVADVEGDGALDIIFRNGDNYVFRSGNGKGEFAPSQVFVGVSRADDLDSGDFDGDGKPDLLRMRKDAPTAILTIGKDGVLTETLIEDTPPGDGLTFAQDVDGDGRFEAVYVGGSEEEGFAELWIQGHGTKPRFDRCLRVPYPASLVEPDRTRNFVAVGDVNGDGKADVLFKNGCAGCAFRTTMLVQRP